MQGWSHADVVTSVAVAFVILVVTMLLLVIGAILWPETKRGAAAVSAWASSLRDDGTTAHELGSYNYREPADPSYVDELIRARGRARVLHRPDPVALPMAAPVVVENPYRVTLADLIEGSRYVVPALPPATSAPAVGRHRRELVAA